MPNTGPAQLNHLSRIRGRLLRLQAFVRDPGDALLDDFTVRLEGLESCWTEYNQVYEDVAAGSSAEEVAEFETQFVEMESVYWTTKAELRRRSQGATSARSVESRSASHPATGSEVKLPRISLPMFSGDYLAWSPFRDMFMSLIHKNMSIGRAQKLQYLKSSLSGEAAALLHSLEITDAQYDEAWDMLNERYQNTRQLIQCHLSALFGQEAIEGEAVVGIRRLVDTTSKHMRALKALDVDTDAWSHVLVFLVTERLDSESRKEWELTCTSKGFPTFGELREYLEKRCRALEASRGCPGPRHGSPPLVNKGSTIAPGKRYSPSTALASTSGMNDKSACALCKAGKHPIYRCSQFLRLSQKERLTAVRKHALCFNCLAQNHESHQCSSQRSCRQCNGRHHTLLHTEEAERQPPRNGGRIPAAASSTEPIASHLGEPSRPRNVLLATAVVQLQDHAGHWQIGRVLLDSGSQASFITEVCVQRLGLGRSKAEMTVAGIGQCGTQKAKGVVTLNIRSRIGQFALATQAFILGKLTNYRPCQPMEAKRWADELNIVLAEWYDAACTTVDVILGADNFADILLDGRLSTSSGKQSAFNTHFGWVLSGTMPDATPTRPTISINHACCTDLDVQIKRFWEQEELQPVKVLTAEEKECEEHFAATYTRDQEGRYVVRLPIRKNGMHLGESKPMVLRRLSQVERRLRNCPQHQQSYNAFMDEYLNLNHMEIVPSEQKLEASTEVNYLPHHFVLNESSSTTKFRVVFDASAKTSTGTSLNDILMVGPKLQDNIWDLLIRFRLHEVAFTADIAKMYRQIRVSPLDADLQRIVWREQPDGELKEFRLTTVTYGTSAAPYLSVKTLHQLALDEGARYPHARDVLTHDFYVDDLISGAKTVSDARQVQDQLIAMLSCAGMQLRKWSSNSTQLLEHLPEDMKELKAPLELGRDESVKTLGLRWHPASDQLTFAIPTLQPRSSTKRAVLSDIAKLYDPLGLLAPVTVTAKTFMQKLWVAGTAWDQTLPGSLLSEWKSFSAQVPLLERIRLPRWVNVTDSSMHELHGFADASELAYGAVVYLRSAGAKEQGTVHCLCAKTRVAPLKQVSLPRLELCGAALLARLLAQVKSTMPLPISRIIAWSDSTITLAWIRGAPRSWKTFVANRVALIQELTLPECWRHVPSGDNPADIISRGLMPEQLIDSQLWWRGPSWLSEPQTLWPMQEIISIDPADQNVPERRTITVTGLVGHTLSVPDLDLIDRYSSLTKLQRVTAWCLRFASNARRPREERQHGPLTTQEIQRATQVCLKVVQAQAFSETIRELAAKGRTSSNLAPLDPFLDKEGLLRVGGRLRNAKIEYGQRFPIILPKESRLTNLLITATHLRLLHAGPQGTLAALQQRYWIVNGRSVVRNVIHRCVTCVRMRGVTLRQKMADLPCERVEPARPFVRTGVDMAGPFQVKVCAGRGIRIISYYIALFVCLATKAVHLEAVSAPTADAFVAAFRRFVSRRGWCSDLYSDNGSNFVGASAKLKSATQGGQALAGEGVSWHFIPPSAPHFGGIWEAGIRSTKGHLTRVVGQTVVTLEEFTTLLAQVEACLNSRPLCPMSTDPSDLDVLTPGHFIVGEPLTNVPEPELLSRPINVRNRWQLVQQMTQHFWKRWQAEYLSHLQQRHKWKYNQSNVKCGDLVLVKEDGTPPCRWIRGRITETHPGNDGRIRVVTVRTATSTFKRPIVKLCLLPV